MPHFHNEIGQIQIPIIISQAALEVDSWVFLSDRNYVIVGVKEVHTVANGATLTADLKVTRSGTAQAPTSGTSILASTLNLNSTDNTIVTGTLSTTSSNLYLNSGDLLGVVLSTDLTSLQGCLITVTLEPR